MVALAAVSMSAIVIDRRQGSESFEQLLGYEWPSLWEFKMLVFDQAI